MIEELGRGGFGVVKKAVRRLLDREEYFAVKILNKMKLKKNRKITVDEEGSIYFNKKYIRQKIFKN